MFSVVVSFGGVTHGVDVNAIVLDDTDFSLSVALDLISRGERPPIVGGMTWREREITVDLFRPDSSSLNGDAWWTYVAGLYAPQGGMRSLTVTHDSITYTTEVYVVERGLVGPYHGRATLVQADPIWRAATPVTIDSGDSPYTPAGNFPARPTITLTKSATAKMREITVTDNSGRGLHNYVVMVGGGDATEGGVMDLSGVSAASVNDYLCYVNGQPRPFFILNPGHATDGVVFVAVDVPAGGTATVTLIYGSSIDNTITAQALDPAGRYWDHPDYGNEKIVWREEPGTMAGIAVGSVWQVSGRPNVPQVWRPGTIAHHNAGEAFSILEASDGASLQIAWATGQGNIIADAIVLETQVKTHATDALKGLGLALNTTSTTWSSTAPGFVIFFGPAAPQGTGGSTVSGNVYEDGLVKYLPLDGIEYLTSNGTDLGSGVLDDFPVPGAVKLGITTLINRLLTVNQQDSSGPFHVLLDTAEIPSISIGAAVDVVHWNAVIENETLEQSITLTDIFTTETEIVIDCRTHQITPADWLRQHSGAGIAWTERYGKFELQDDVANTITVTGSGVTWEMDVADALVL